MPFLKTPDGYSVGTVECVVPVEKPIIAGNAKIRGYEEAGIRVEEVAFTIFYPADVQSGDKKHRRGLRWLTGCVISLFSCSQTLITMLDL